MIDVDKLLNNSDVERIMNDTSHESWCINCGNTQGTNHLGSQKCNNSGKEDCKHKKFWKVYSEGDCDMANYLECKDCGVHFLR